MISKFLDWFSEFLANRKGLLPLIGIVLVVINYFLTGGNLLLHLGVMGYLSLVIAKATGDGYFVRGSKDLLSCL